MAYETCRACSVQSESNPFTLAQLMKMNKLNETSNAQTFVLLMMAESDLNVAQKELEQRNPYMNIQRKTQ